MHAEGAQAGGIANQVLECWISIPTLPLALVLLLASNDRTVVCYGLRVARALNFTSVQLEKVQTAQRIQYEYFKFKNSRFGNHQILVYAYSRAKTHNS